MSTTDPSAAAAPPPSTGTPKLETRSGDQEGRFNPRLLAELACWGLAVLTLTGCVVFIFSLLVSSERTSARDGTELRVDLSKPEDLPKLNAVNTFLSIENQRTLTAIERQTAAVHSCVALAGIAVLFIAFALLLGAIRPATESAVTAGFWDSRLVRFLPGVVALVCATAVLAAVSSDGRSGSGKSGLPQYGVPASGGFGFGAAATGFG